MESSQPRATRKRKRQEIDAGNIRGVDEGDDGTLEIPSSDTARKVMLLQQTVATLEQNNDTLRKEYAQFHSEATLAREKLESKLQTYEDELEDLRDYKDDLLEELQQWKKKYGLGEKTSREIVDYVEEDDVYTWYSVLCEEIQRITQLFHMNLKRKSAKMQLTHRRNDVSLKHLEKYAPPTAVKACAICSHVYARRNKKVWVNRFNWPFGCSCVMHSDKPVCVMCMAQMNADLLAQRKCCCPFCRTPLDGEPGKARLQTLRDIATTL